MPPFPGVEVLSPGGEGGSDEGFAPGCILAGEISSKLYSPRSCDVPGPGWDDTRENYSCHSGKHGGPGEKIEDDVGSAWAILGDSYESLTVSSNSDFCCDLVRVLVLSWHDRSSPDDRRYDSRG